MQTNVVFPAGHTQTAAYKHILAKVPRKLSEAAAVDPRAIHKEVLEEARAGLYAKLLSIDDDDSPEVAGARLTLDPIEEKVEDRLGDEA